MELSEPVLLVPRVAVVIPCCDEPLVVDAVSSLALEEPLELVVVDDGSEDPATLAALADLRAQGVRVLRQRNSGLARARMRGVFETAAPYVLALDADDWLEPGALAALADALDSDEAMAVAWGDLLVERAGKRSFRRPSAPFLDPWLTVYVNAVPACSLVRRSALLEVGGWQEAVGYADKDLWLRLAERGRSGVHLERVAYHYRLDAGGMFRSSLDRFAEREAATLANHDWLTKQLAEWRRRSRAPMRLKLAFALVERLPLSWYRRNRLCRALFHLLWVGTPYCALHYLRDRP